MRKTISKYLLLFGLTVALRVVFLMVGFIGFGDTIPTMFSRSDAGSYLAVSKGIYLGPEKAAMTTYDTRVFLGWPLLFGWGNWLGIGDFVLISTTVMMAGLVPCLFFKLTDNFPTSLLLTFFTPAWILQTVNPMGEAAYLSFGLLGVLFFKRDRLFLAGLALGLMFAVRPYAIVVIGGVFVAIAFRALSCYIPLSPLVERAKLSKGDKKLVVGRNYSNREAMGSLALFIFGCAIIPGICGFLNVKMYGDLFHQLHAYGKSLDDLNIGTEAAKALGNPSGHWGPPFWYTLSFPWKIETPLWKVIYIYSHVILLVIGMVYVLQKTKSIFWQKKEPIDQIMFCWFVGNGVLIICSGPYWGFHSFDRYFLWGWPPLLWFLRDRIQFRWSTFVPLFFGSVGLVVFAWLRHFYR